MKQLDKLKKVGNIKILYFLLTLSVIIFASISITIGVADITTKDVIDILAYKLMGRPLGEHISSGQQTIVWTLRLPRILMAILTGANLAVTGAVYQAIFRNDMADPYMLGISSGASLGAAIGFVMGGFSPFYAFIGALVANVLVLKLSGVRERVSTIRLLLSGMAINYFFSSFLSLIRTYAQDKSITIFAWGMGSLSAASYTRVGILAGITLPILSIFLVYRKELNLLLMGEDAAKTLGVDVTRVRKLLLVLSSILIATTVSFTGTIGFVGLVIPHIVRLIFGYNYKVTLPICGLFGMLFLLFCDNLSRALGTNGEIPIGIITSLLGAPYFMYLIYRGRKGER
ncbi:MAG: iron ABC transporter permease [Cellulosilyticaceae bacterium]